MSDNVLDDIKQTIGAPYTKKKNVPTDEVLVLRRAGYSWGQIAKYYGCGISTVQKRARLKKPTPTEKIPTKNAVCTTCKTPIHGEIIAGKDGKTYCRPCLEKDGIIPRSKSNRKLNI